VKPLEKRYSTTLKIFQIVKNVWVLWVKNFYKKVSNVSYAVILLDNDWCESISFYKNDAVLTDDERTKCDTALDWLRNCVRDKKDINLRNKK
jgi:hypothetical protein